MKEIEIKKVLVEYLLRKDNHCILGAEVPFQYGSRRADIVSISGLTAKAFEIKGAGDSVDRLSYQIASYKAYFDYCYVVCEESNLPAIRKNIGREIGILLATNFGIREIRKSQIFKRHDKESLASTISLDTLKKTVNKKSLRSKHDFCEAISREYDVHFIRNISRQELREKYYSVTRQMRAETVGVLNTDDILTISRMPPAHLFLKS